MMPSPPGFGPVPCPVPAAVLVEVAAGVSYDPHSVLGPRVIDGTLTIRVLHPLASSVTVLTADGELPMTHEQDGIWVAAAVATEVPDYRLRVSYDLSLIHI